ncbi:hypothetical protein D8W71_22290 [Rhodococcus sp. P1Y]|nr:hypothetical protein D8W71_22290 [Rhodococcus sp. P1Y]
MKFPAGGERSGTKAGTTPRKSGERTVTEMANFLVGTPRYGSTIIFTASRRRTFKSHFSRRFF